MTETSTEAPIPAATGIISTKKKTFSTQPPISQMVIAAIKALKDRCGSSTQKIKKYITCTYNINVEKKSYFIRKYLKSAVASGTLIQTKGKGAKGSFKLPAPGGKKPTAPPKTPSTAVATKKSSRKSKGSKTNVLTKKVVASIRSGDTNVLIQNYFT